VKYAPGNDPFVITVGAVALMKHGLGIDAAVAPWSAYGYTYDGFLKPEVVAPGRYMVGPVPASSTLAAQLPDHVTAPGYMELSGTSFSAPVVAGTVAQMLALHPTWTPDQVKGALMVTTRPASKDSPPLSSGVGEVNADRAIKLSRTPPNPNKALDQFVKPDAATGGLSFDAVSWYDAATASVSWDSVSWMDVSWNDAAFNAVSWQDVSWQDVSWQDVSWNDISWSDATADVSWEDAAEADASAPAPQLTDDAAQALLCDPQLNDTLDPSCTASTSSTDASTTSPPSTDASTTTAASTDTTATSTDAQPTSTTP
jgi:serine protease AprX